MTKTVRMHQITTVSVKDVALTRNVISMPTTSVIFLLFKANFKAVFQQALAISISTSTMEQIQVPTFVTEKDNDTM